MSSHGHTRAVCTGATVSGAFSALHLLRSYSLLAPGTEFCRYDPYGGRDYNFGDGDVLSSSGQSETTGSPLTGTAGLTSGFPLPGGLLQPPFIAAMPPLIPSINVPQPFTTANPAAMVTRHYVAANGLAAVQKRPRSEKKPIPDEQKDEKYYERRKRNNQAAKKSRDARKIREDHIALRATMLEHENAILRAQVITLREEAQSLRHMLIKQQQQQQQQQPIQAMDRSISSMTPVTLSPPPHPSATLDCQV